MQRRSLALLRLRTAPSARTALPCSAHHSRRGLSAGIQAHSHGSSRTSNHAHTPPVWLSAAALSAGAVLACCGTVHADIGASTVEAETGVTFAGWRNGQALAGTGCRLMGGIVRVYAVGVYVSPIALRASLRAHKGRQAAELLTDAKFWSDVCTRTEAVVRLVVAREVTGAHMATGFERGLTKATKRSASHKRFAALFKKLGVMKVGSEVIIRCEKGIVELLVDGRHVGSVDDNALAPDILAMYLGERAVTPSLKADAARGFADLLVD